ncbi:uncharacterized protein UTRI_06247_B [Ustilago trichophora]|uniref:Uncharacterized protein n=1 Tax=Ustilago trichophora TaxID=86804 RepID=A0A5C3EIQ7_9BASI|nr:uncharacterized protein UTRI_06247_B [Ustilago trichophora]
MRVNQLSPFVMTLLAISSLPSILAIFTRKTKVVPEPLPAPMMLPPPHISYSDQPFDVRFEPRSTIPPQLESLLRSRYPHNGAHVRRPAEIDMATQELEELIRQDGNSKRFIQLGTHGMGRHGMDLAMVLPPVPGSTERKFALISLRHNGNWRNPWVELHGFAEASNVPFLEYVLHRPQPGILDRITGKVFSAREAFDAIRFM